MIGWVEGCKGLKWRLVEGKPEKELVENFPEVKKGIKTRDIVAKKVGFGNPKTYEQAKKVVDQSTELVGAMDSKKAVIGTSIIIA